MNRVKDRVWGDRTAHDQICSEVSPVVRYRFSGAEVWRLVWREVHNQVHGQVADALVGVKR